MRKNVTLEQEPAGIPLVVTTIHRGVFFGYARPSEAKTIRLTQAQMCVHWSVDMKGILGLAAQGPSRNCRVGPPVPAITLMDVTSVIECTTQAEAAWKQQPWN